MNEFKCISCASCCKRVKNVPQFEITWIKEDGSCRKLQPNGECSIYETRPEICRTNEYFENHIQHIDGTTLTEWQEMNHYACKTMIEADYGDQHPLFKRMVEILNEY